MAREADFQSKVLKWLRSKGCIAYKMQQNATTRIATPDILFIKEGFWGAIECKAWPERDGGEIGRLVVGARGVPAELGYN